MSGNGPVFRSVHCFWPCGKIWLQISTDYCQHIRNGACYEGSEPVRLYRPDGTIRYFSEILDIIGHEDLPTRLQTQRKIAGYSQRELAEKSGVNIRTLQQYESGAKDINKASGSALLALSKALGCRMEDLLEYQTGE